MDASGEGLCALDPAHKRYLRQRFSLSEAQALSINIRELRSAVLAVLHWGPTWYDPHNRLPQHIQFHIDNTSAVTWANRRTSKHPTSQLYNRLLSLAEFQYNLICTASHIPGKLNVMADAGSRAWGGTDTISKVWSNLSASWSQDLIESPFDDLSVVWEHCCSATPWQSLPIPSTARTGTNGAVLQETWDGPDGSHQQARLADLDISPRTAGLEEPTANASVTSTALSS
ncbi:Primary ciliary dyskinesia protein 1 [Phytophthora nicotianae]|uniref:Primary ciliary dyskinesia protein 1 n=1 Tax=Phytophthora nicotianae TaxID=4792 RepID=A0A0W8D5Y3_PHYNI|nr:Primary ciliary dyskinesia protein 1 [Phytophthora nicotianae]